LNPSSIPRISIIGQPAHRYICSPDIDLLLQKDQEEKLRIQKIEDDERLRREERNKEEEEERRRREKEKKKKKKEKDSMAPTMPERKPSGRKKK
jgi:hypothetical protein